MRLPTVTATCFSTQQSRIDTREPREKKTQKLNYKLSQPVERFTVSIFAMLLIVPPPMPRGTANEKQDKKTVELIEIFIHSLIQSIAKLIKHETIRISVRLDID